LRDHYESAAKGGLFQKLKPLLADEAPESYGPIASRLGMSEGAVKVAVHRLRRRYRDALREEIAETVSDPEEIEAELRYLRSVLRDA
jgi:RNA polymerase sigma-70 factor (ECF subfamily)